MTSHRLLRFAAIVGVVAAVMFTVFMWTNPKQKAEEIVVYADSPWLYQWESAEELIDHVQVHLVVEATVLPTSKPIQLADASQPRTENRMLTDIQINRIFKSTREDVRESEVIPIIETTSIVRDEQSGNVVEYALGDYRKAESGLSYIFVRSWNPSEQKYHVSSAQYGKYNLDGKDKREQAVEQSNDHYAALKKEMLLWVSSARNGT